MTFEITFFILFFIQVVLISLYFPRRIIQRSNEFIEQYPPSSHPRLYGWPVEEWQATTSKYRGLSLTIFVVGLILLLGLMIFGFPESLLATWFIWFVFTVLQIVCNVWRMKMATNCLKAIELDEPSIRSAELVRRRITDYVPPLHWCLAIASILLMLVAVSLVAVEVGYIARFALLLVPLFMSGMFIRNGLKLVRGEIGVPQIARALKERVVIEQEIRSVPVAMIRVNLTIVVVALVLSGAQEYVLVAVCALFVANSAYEFFMELRTREEDVLDMKVFEKTPPLG